MADEEIPVLSESEYKSGIKERGWLRRDQKIAIVPDDGKAFVAVDHHTVCDGKVVKFARRFIARYGVFGDLHEATDNWEISASRNAVIVHAASFRIASSIEAVRAFAEALEAADTEMHRLAAADGSRFLARFAEATSGPRLSISVMDIKKADHDLT